MVFTTEGLFEIAIKGWSEWDLNPRPLNFAMSSSARQVLKYHKRLNTTTTSAQITQKQDGCNIYVII